MGAEQNGAEAGSPDWASLLRETEAFAEWQIARHYWRGERGGVLPDGYDASAVAAEAVREVLREEAEGSRGTMLGRDQNRKQDRDAGSNRNPKGGREGGREVEDEDEDENEDEKNRRGLQWRLNRWVFRIVGRLNHRKETKAMRNDLDLPLQSLSNCGQGEMGSMIESVAAASEEPDWQAEEDERRLERLRAETRDRLGGDKRAKSVFECMCGGVLRNAEIAKALGMKEKAVRTARRRIKRRIAELRREARG